MWREYTSAVLSDCLPSAMPVKPGGQAYEVATTEDPFVMTVAEQMAELADEEFDVRPEVKLVVNPRGSSKTLVEDSSVDISNTKVDLGWEPQYSVDASIRNILRY